MAVLSCILVIGAARNECPLPALSTKTHISKFGLDFAGMGSVCGLKEVANLFS